MKICHCCGYEFEPTQDTDEICDSCAQSIIDCCQEEMARNAREEEYRQWAQEES